MKVYIYKIKGETARLKGVRSNCMFSEHDDLAADNEEIYATVEVTPEEYDFMIEYWDNCLDQYGYPEIYLPNGTKSLILTKAA